MPTNFPTSVDNFTNPTANDSLNLPSHSTQHANANDAIEAVEDYLLNGAGRSGLVLVKTQTIGTAVSSVTVSSAFSSTYDNYQIVVSGGVASTTGNLLLTLGSSNTNYYTGGMYVPYNSATVFALNSNNTGSFPNAISMQTDNLTGGFSLFSPNLPKTTGFTLQSFEPNSGGIAIWRNGFHNEYTTHTAFTLTTSSGTMTGGTICVYGYRKS
jgi:hypothetical protein